VAETSPLDFNEFPREGWRACACGAPACFFYDRPGAPTAAWCFTCAPAEFTPGLERP
jgi:hypothetical protein